MNKLILRICLIILAILSLYSDISINDESMFAYRNTFDILNLNFIDQVGGFDWLSFLQRIFLLLSGCMILIFPFLFQKIKYFKIILIIVPLLFLICQTYFFIPLAIGFIPFTVIWIITIFLANSERKLKR